MKRINKNVLKAVEQVTRNEINRDKVHGHPFCLGIFHQPKRPLDSKAKI